METSSFFVPLLRSFSGWEADFAMDMSRLTALSIRLWAGVDFQTKLSRGFKL